jgi:hypothetical protein
MSSHVWPKKKGVSATDFADSSSVDFTVNTTTGVVTATVVPGGVNHDALQNFVANKHIDHSTVTITGTDGLAGGGDITASRTLNLPDVGTAGTFGSASQVPVLTTDAKGRVSGVTNTAISLTSSAISDFQEAAQDAAGLMVTDTSSIDLVYDDALAQITATVLPAGVDHNSLMNYSANRHIDHTAVSISAGSGLSGGGDISANRTISMPNVGTAGTYGSATQVAVVTTDAQGRVSGASSTAINVTSSAISDFNEAAQDAVGSALTDTSSVDFTYNDALGQISATVLPAGVDHNSLNNYVANRHIDHTAVSVIAGTGLTGGGTIAADRTLSLTNVGTAGTYKSVTTDAQGRVTAGTNPTTLSGYGITDAQPLDADLTAVAGLSSTGIIARTGAGTASVRTITGTASQITVTNGDGVSGNPTISLPDIITASTVGSASGIPNITYDAKGRITATNTNSVNITSSNVSNFSTAAVSAAQSGCTGFVNNLTNSGFGHFTTTVTAGTTTVVASAQMQVDSTTKGFLPPRMTSAQRIAISSPATGLTVFDTTLSALFVYDGVRWCRQSTSERKITAIGTAQANTTMTVAGVSFRYSSNATAGNLDVKSDNGVRRSMWLSSHKMTFAGTLVQPQSTQFFAEIATWTTVSVGNLNATDTVWAQVFDQDTQQIWRVHLTNEVDVLIFLHTEAY